LVGLLGWPTLLGAALATEASIVSNFLLNNWLTFRQAQGQRPFVLRLLRYNGFALGGMLISLLTLALLTYGLHIHYLLANLVATGAAMAWNYIASSRWVWASPSAAQEVV
nr:GtrA family protein [Chloroflexaceae bacterium]